jgi:hypothetical protein
MFPGPVVPAIQGHPHRRQISGDRDHQREL